MGDVKTEEKKQPEAEKPLDGEFKEESSTALAVAPQPMEVALSTQDPTAFLQRAVAQADALKGIIDTKKLSIQIGTGTKRHVLIDGWQTLMALNGVMPRTTNIKRELCDSRSCSYPKCEGGKLTVLVTTELRRVQDSLLLTVVEAECSQHEPRWSKAEHYAITSMAQTRGIGKACRQLYGWVMALAGYDATPAEEMDGVKGREEAAAPSPTANRKPSGQAGLDTAREQQAERTATAKVPWTDEQKDRVRARVKVLQAEKHPVLYKGWKDFMVSLGQESWKILYSDQALLPKAYDILGIEVTNVEPVKQPEFDPTGAPA